MSTNSVESWGITISISAECGAAADGEHAWTQDFIEIDTFRSREYVPVGWRCKRCGIGANDPDEIEYRQLLDSVISETLREETSVPRASTAVEAIDREIKGVDRLIRQHATRSDAVAAKIMELDKLRQRHAIERRALEARLDALHAARESLVDKPEGD